jgi:hypothetical protein
MQAAISNHHMVIIFPYLVPTTGTSTLKLRHFFGTVERTASQDLLFGKLDWRPNNRNSITANFNLLDWESLNGVQTAAVTTNAGGFGFNGNATVKDRWARLSYTAILSPTPVNEFRFGWFRDRQLDDTNPKLATIARLHQLNGVVQKSLTLQGANATDKAVGPIFPARLLSLDRVPPAGTVDVKFASQDLSTPYTNQGDLTVEHEITKDMGISISYLTTRGFKLITRQNLVNGVDVPNSLPADNSTPRSPGETVSG